MEPAERPQRAARDREGQEDRIQQALRALAAGEITSERQAAKTFNVPRTTLKARMLGGRTHAQAHVSSQRLSPEEEETIARACLQLSAWGWAITVDLLETLGAKLLKDKGDPSKLGVNWNKNFLTRHPEVKLKRLHGLNPRRRDGLNHQILTEWFNLFETAVLKHNIHEDDFYNMDEKGVMRELGDIGNLIFSRADQPGNREWAAVMECIGANGYSLPPYVIFQGQRVQSNWSSQAIDPNTVVQVSSDGWANPEIALAWLKHFDYYTKPQLRRKYRMLVLDGHPGHLSCDFVDYCTQNDIVALCLPPHGAFEIQPLDMTCILGPLVETFEKVVRRRSISGAHYVDHKQFLLYYQEARICMLPNIPPAWKGAGLAPYDSSELLDHYRLKTPPYVTLTDSHGRRLDIVAGPSLAQRIDEMVEQVFEQSRAERSTIDQ